MCNGIFIFACEDNICYKAYTSCLLERLVMLQSVNGCCPQGTGFLRGIIITSLHNYLLPLVTLHTIDMPNLDIVGNGIDRIVL